MFQAYLISAVAHRTLCHTPRDLFYAHARVPFLFTTALIATTAVRVPHMY